MSVKKIVLTVTFSCNYLILSPCVCIHTVHHMIRINYGTFMTLWYCGTFYRLLLLCWGWWMDLAAFYHSPPSPLLQVGPSCFSSAASLEWKQNHKQMNIRIISQPSNRGREDNQDGLEIPWCQTAFHPSGNPPWNHPLVCKEPFGSQDFDSQDFTILSFFFFFEPEENHITTSAYTLLWCCFKYMHISIYYTFHMLRVALCTMQ